jgi:hypothetical protein
VEHVDGPLPGRLGVTEVLRIRVLGVARQHGLGRDRRLERRSERHRIQRAADQEHRIAQDLGLQPLRPATPEQPIVGVLRGAGGIVSGILPISGAGDDQPMDRLEPPAAGRELVGEPLQQLRMRGPLAADAEVADGAHQALPEVVLPDPVDHHAGQERAGPLVQVGDPVRQGPTLAGAPVRADLPARGLPVVLRRPRAGEHREEADLEPLLLRVEVPALQEPGRLGRGLPIHDREGRRGRGGLRTPGVLDLGLQGVPPPAPLVGERPPIVVVRDREVLRVLCGKLPGRLRVGLILQQSPVLVADRQGVDLRDPQRLGQRLLLRGQPVVQRLLGRLRPPLPSRDLLAIAVRLGPRDEERLLAPGRGEGALNPVVIAGRDGVVLVVVAAGAAERQAEEGRDGRDRHVVELVVPEPELLLLHGHVQLLGLRGRQEARGRQCLGVVGLVLVARDLPPHEGRVRQVVVEGADHEVAVVVGGRPVGVRLQPVAVGVAGDVQPVPAPALAVVPAGQEPIDEPLVGVGCGVLDERPHLLRGRGQADQVEIDPSNQGPPVGRGVRADVLCFEGGEHEPIDRVATPALVIHARGIDGADRPVGPVPPVLGVDDHLAPTGPGRRRDLPPVGPLVDPGPKDAGLVASERVGAERHPLPFVVRFDATDQLALVGLARRDRPLSRIRGAECAGPQVEPQAALLLLRTVARPAGTRQDRSDISGEVHAFLVRRRRPGCRHDENHQQQRGRGFHGWIVPTAGAGCQAIPPVGLRFPDVCPRDGGSRARLSADVRSDPVGR